MASAAEIEAERQRQTAASGSSNDNDTLAQLTALFEKSQAANSSAQNTATKLTKEELKTRLKIAQGGNETQIKVAQGNNATQQSVANMEAQARAALSEKEQQAANERQAAELASRLGISNNEQAAAMARLEQELGVKREELSQNLLISNNELGFKREELAANVKTESDKIAQAREEMLKIGIPTMLANKWKQEQDVALAQEAQKIDREKIGVDRGRLGFDVFSKAVDLASSPASRYQFGDFAAGLAKNPQARDWFAAMAQSSNGSGFGPSADAGTQPITPDQAMADFYTMMGVSPSGTAGAPGNPTGVGMPPGTGAGSNVIPFPQQPGSNPDITVGQQMLDMASTVLSGSPDQQAAFMAHYQASLAAGASHVQAVHDAYASIGGDPLSIITALPNGAVASLPPALQAVLGSGGQSGAASAGGAEQVYAGGSSSFNEGGAAAAAATNPAVYAGGSSTFNEATGGTAAPGLTTTQISPGLQAYLDQQNKELGQIGAIRDAGGSALAPGTLESMSKDDLAEFQSGLSKLRTDVPAWMRDYTLSRPGQANPEQMAA